MQTEIREQLLYKLQNLDETTEAFDRLAMDIFQYQAVANPVFHRFLNLLRKDPLEIHHWSQIPALPVSFFKNYPVKTGDWSETTVFSSSGTTGQIPSQHFVRDARVYLDNTLRGFSAFYGDPADWTILALLPNYLERSGSSLVAMADYFIQRSKFPESGFFLHNFDDLYQTLTNLRDRNNVLLLGVSFALLDFGEKYPMDLSNVTIMETGGMKGRRKELTRNELHDALKTMFHTNNIHSEYGMTEMFSQGYAMGGEIFRPCPTLRMFTTEINDPLSPTPQGRSGVLNIIDLANIDSCSFIATEDIGRVFNDGSFSVLGRLDAAEMRGCNLMAPINGSFE
jgi:phenylacetate-coenzyme A ligase PaaK-like adenylate-forming protein